MARCCWTVLLGGSAGTVSLRKASQLPLRLEVDELVASLPCGWGHDRWQWSRRRCCLPAWIESVLASDRPGYHHHDTHLRRQPLVSSPTGQSRISDAHLPPYCLCSVHGILLGLRKFSGLPYATPGDVFFTFRNGGGWASIGAGAPLIWNRLRHTSGPSGLADAVTDCSFACMLRVAISRPMAAHVWAVCLHLAAAA